jgi:quinol monooxygenase YgiN
MRIVGENMVIEIVDIKTSSEKYEELRKALSSLSGPTEAEAGCERYQVYQQVSDTGVLRIETHWKTEGDLLRHIRSNTYKRLLLLMELGSERPTIEFYTVSKLRGLDLIWETRIRPASEMQFD